MYYIVAKYKGQTETVDETGDLDNALYLCNEYKLAFGQEWTVWVSETEDGPPPEEQMNRLCCAAMKKAILDGYIIRPVGHNDDDVLVYLPLVICHADASWLPLDYCPWCKADVRASEEPCKIQPN